MNWTDKELLERCIGGDERGWTEAMRRYGRRLYALAVCNGVDRAAAEDVVQETFRRASRRVAGCRDYFPGWLDRIAFNVSMDWHRKKAAAKLVAEPVEEPMAPRRDSGSRWVARREWAERLHRAMGALTATEREAVELVDLQELSYEAAAEKMGCTVEAVRTARCRGRQRLARMLGDETGWVTCTG